MTPQVVRDVNEAVRATETPQLGVVLWWSFAGIEVSVPEMETRCQRAGLDPGLVPHPRPDGALRRALAAVGVTEDDGAGTVRRFGLQYPEGSVVATVWDETVDTRAGTARYAPVQVVQYDRATLGLAFSTGYLAAEIREAWGRAQGTLNASGLAALVKRVLDAANAIRLREAGGLYFVPIAHEAATRAVRELVEGLGGADVVTFPIADVEAVRRDVLAAASREISRELVGLDTELAVFDARVAEGDLPHVSTIDARLGDYQATREKILAYAELVGYASAEACAKVQALEERARTLADKVAREKIARKRAVVRARR